MKKLLITLILLTGLSVQAKTPSINKVIYNSGINKESVSVSVKNTNNGKELYSLNANKPISPASTLKVVTATVAADTLGKNFNFTTSLYKTTNNELQLKLSGDPNFNRRNLAQLIKTAKSKNIIEPKAFYIDDYVMDSVEWGEGWQWDDDLNPLMPKFSSYNIDGNILHTVVDPTNLNAPAKIHLINFYPITFMNLVTTGKENSIEISRNNNISPDIITVSGTINSRKIYPIPVNYPKRYFLIRLDEEIRNAKLQYYGKFIQRKTPSNNIYLVDEVKHPIEISLYDTLKNSNNLSAETLFKVAGGKFVNNTGAIKNSLKMFDEYCTKNELDYENIKIVDGSGVSKNNLMTANFMTDFLVLQSKRSDFEDYKKMFPTAGEGTMKNRMLYFRENLYAKTGTLSDISAICGYITTRNGNLVAFDIMINDAKSTSAEKKAAEEQIIREIYNKY